MNITAPLRLVPDLLLMPVSELDSEMQQRCECPPGHFVVSRPNSRTASRVVNDAVARLLARFMASMTIVEAALHECTHSGDSPETTLEAVHAALQPFLRAGWIVDAEEAAAAVQASFEAGEHIDGYRIVRLVSLVEDTEIYQVMTPAGQLAALKLATANFAEAMVPMLAREAELLCHLRGVDTPRMLGAGIAGQRHYIVSTWFDGNWANKAADALREQYGRAAIPELLALCCRIATAFARLHEAGVLHGDTGPKNVLVASDGEVALIDFGLGARIAPNNAAPKHRGGVPEYHEPELAAHLLEKGARIVASREGEQYGLAVLLYRLLCGAPYLRLSPVRDLALRQIVAEPPLPFAEHGLAPYPSLESVLRRALNKDPRGRYPSVRDFAAALSALRDHPATGGDTPASTLTGALAVPRVEGIDPNELLKGKAAFSSVAHGAAGIAFGLYVMSANGGAAYQLAKADAWSRRAQNWMEMEGAFASAALHITPEQAGSGSVWYGRAGVFLVRALIAMAIGDTSARDEAWGHYRSTCGQPGAMTDITNGLAGQLLGCAWLLDAAGSNGRISEEIRRLGERIQRDLLDRAMLQAAAGGAFLGAAHGIAGHLYATLVWSEVAADAVPPQVMQQLGWLASQAIKVGPSIHFPMRYEQNGVVMESWCHGTPGYVHLFAAAHRKLGGDAWLELLEGCAWSTWRAAGRHGSSLCCGDAGKAYALLSAWRSTGDEAWRGRAQALAAQANARILCERASMHGLYKGALGCTVLASDLENAARASMPLFERDRRGG